MTLSAEDTAESCIHVLEVTRGRSSTGARRTDRFESPGQPGPRPARPAVIGAGHGGHTRAETCGRRPAPALRHRTRTRALTPTALARTDPLRTRGARARRREFGGNPVTRRCSHSTRERHRLMTAKAAGKASARAAAVTADQWARGADSRERTRHGTRPRRRRRASS